MEDINAYERLSGILIQYFYELVEFYHAKYRVVSEVEVGGILDSIGKPRLKISSVEKIMYDRKEKKFIGSSYCVLIDKYSKDFLLKVLSDTEGLRVSSVSIIKLNGVEEVVIRCTEGTEYSFRYRYGKAIKEEER